MNKKVKSEKLFLSKLFYTLMIITVYCFCRCIPLIGVDYAVTEGQVNVQNTLFSALDGDIEGYSIMALGIMPYFLAQLISQIIMAVRNIGSKKLISPKKMQFYTLFLMILICLIVGIRKLEKMTFVAGDIPVEVMKLFAGLEMITGAIVLLWLCSRNKKYGLGGQTAIIMVNIVNGILNNIGKGVIVSRFLPVWMALIMNMIMLYMENGEKRIPLQRISIQNIYADKNYQSLKFNPTGIFPVMFATAVYMLPQMGIEALREAFPNHETIGWMAKNMSLDNWFGMSIYFVVMFLLNILFSLLMIAPGDMTEQLLKSGDSIVNIHPGKATKRYLVRNVWMMAIISSVVLCTCIGITQYLQNQGIMRGCLASLPTSALLLTGISCTLYREAEAIIHTDSYEAFI